MNFGTPVPLLIGIILILGALALFFLEKFRPGYERDSDKVYAVLLLISGLFLLAHLDMELLASFQQLLMAGMLTALLIESIRSRLPRAEVQPPLNSRAPRPRYNERPPARRVYRAELDDRGNAFREPARAPRMAPAQEEYWRNDQYANERARQPRQPYEEYRGPAGQLQPSEEPGRYADEARYSDSNGRYGDRPPARGPMNSSANPSANSPINPSANPSAERSPMRPAQNPPDWRAEQPNEWPNERPNGRPSERFSEEPNGRFNRRPDAQPPQSEGFRASPDQRAGEDNRDRPGKGDRALNVRPYSEAPKLDSPRDLPLDADS